MKTYLTALFAILIATQIANAQTKIALVSGVEHYENRNLENLEYAEDDARQVQTELSKLGFSVTTVLGDEATNNRLAASIDQFIEATKTLNKPDIAIVYFSGHCVQKLVTSKDADGRIIEIDELFLCPNDSTVADVSNSLSLNSILQRLDDESGSSHNIILLDASRVNASKGMVDGGTIREMGSKFAIFYACEYGRRSFESSKLHHGIFTHYLLDGLRGKAADSNNEVSFLGLASHVSKHVERESAGLLEIPVDEAQRPTLMSNLSGAVVLGRIERPKP